MHIHVVKYDAGSVDDEGSTHNWRKSMSHNVRNFAPLPQIGMQSTLSRTITEEDILLFAQASGDRNPIHLDPEYAKGTIFGKRIAHGSLTASLISSVLGNDLPGPGTIYLEQTLKFLAPVYIGDTITVKVEVVAVREDKRIVILQTDCTNQSNTLVLSGQATVKYMKEVGAPTDERKAESQGR
jgi:3-hydroxybutyryl-CoA dehydratase